MLELAIVQLNGNGRVFMQHLTGGEVVNGTSVEVTHSVEVRSFIKRNLCMDGW